jgi:hypothetical protein
VYPLEWQAIMAARNLVRLLALPCLCVAICSAQPPAAPPKFAVEIPGGNGGAPSYSMVDDSASSLLYEPTFHQLAGGIPGLRKPSVLKLNYKVAGDSVSITATALYGKLDPDDEWGSLEKMEHEIVGTYSGQLNQSVTFSGMERVGLEPLTVRIVTAQSDHPYMPQTQSNAPSLQMDFAPQDRVFGMVTVHNLSPKPVMAFQFGSEDGTQGAERGGLSELIAPHGTYQTRYSPGRSSRLVDGVMVENPPPARLALEAALFADGSYEGDMQIAAQMAGRENGSEVQRQRIEKLVDKVLADPQTDQEAKVKLIRTQAGQLSDEPDAQMIARLRTQFPKLSESGFADAKPELGHGMANEKSMFDHDLDQFADNGVPSARRATLAVWWAAIHPTR